LLLALRRSEKEVTRPCCWDLCGGSLDAEDIEKWRNGSGLRDENDILLKAASREVAEETSLAIENINVVHVASGFNEKKGVFIVAIGYVCDILNGRNLRLSKEHSGYKWVTREGFGGLDIGEDGGLIKAILEKVRD